VGKVDDEVGERGGDEDESVVFNQSIIRWTFSSASSHLCLY
jgi:hypothetical protein